MLKRETYGAVKCWSEKDLDFDLVVLADDALTGTHKISVWFGGLDLEHDRGCTLVNELDIC